MFLEKVDLLKIFQQHELEEISEGDDTVIDAMLYAAVDEMRAYLSDNYDIAAIFGKNGNDRNQLLVRIGCDIAAYHLIAGDVAGQDREDRRQRYDRSIDWLKMISKKTQYADLEQATEEEGDEEVNYGSNKKRRNYY